jgi:hypothetical protein
MNGIKYDTHFNLFHPYEVYITKDEILIVPKDSLDFLPAYQNKVSKSVYIPRYKKVWVPDGERRTGNRVTYLPSAKGNSILVDYDHQRYVYIGPDIIFFRTDQPILDYHSPIIGADIPYPYAESKDYYYLLMKDQHVKVPKTDEFVYENKVEGQPFPYKYIG